MVGDALAKRSCTNPTGLDIGAHLIDARGLPDARTAAHGTRQASII